MTWDLSGNIIYPSGIEAAKIVHWFPKHPLGTKLAAYFKENCFDQATKYSEGSIIPKYMELYESIL